MFENRVKGLFGGKWQRRVPRLMLGAVLALWILPLRAGDNVGNFLLLDQKGKAHEHYCYSDLSTIVYSGPRTWDSWLK